MAIMVQLQSKKVVKAQELAERFQVSLRTIYRDIRSLESAGVALYGEAGSGYSIMEGYRLPPVMFTREEAGSFVAAEKLMQKFSDANLEGHFGSAMFKIKSVLRNAEKDWVAGLESSVSIFSSQKDHHQFLPNVLDHIFEGLAGKKQLKIVYQSLNAEKVQPRTVETIGLFHENLFWYIYAYCHLRKDYRQFRIDRIKEIEILELNYSLTHPSVGELRKRNHNEGDKIEVKLLVDKKVVRFLQYNRDYYGFVSEKEKENQVEMTFLTYDSGQAFLRWYMMFADFAKIVKPISMKKKVKELLEAYHRNLL